LLIQLHQQQFRAQQKCRIPLLAPLQGFQRLLEASTPICVDEGVADPIRQADCVINIEDLQSSIPLSPPAPPTLGEGVQGEEDNQEALNLQDLEVPLPLPHESELQVGLLAGTVSWGLPKKVEVSACLLGGMLQVGTEMDPLQTFDVALLASVLALAWDMCLTPFRQACAR
jgi:hypothetical protein